MTRNDQSRITEESDQYRTHVWQEIGYTTVTKADGSSIKTPILLTLHETEEVTYNKQIMEDGVAQYKTKNPAAGLSGLIGNVASMAGIPGASLIKDFLGSGNESGGGFTGIGSTNELLITAGAAWAAERRMAAKRRTPPNPRPLPVEGRITGNTSIREERV